MNARLNEANNLQHLGSLIDNFSEWQPPLPLSVGKAIDFNPDWLPTPLNEYASSIAESIQVPVDMAAISILAALSLCTSKKYVVKVKQDYTEPLNLYCVIVADPSERKSSVLREVTAPISEIEVEEALRLAPEIVKSAAKKRILAKKLQLAEDRASKGKVTYDEVEQAAEELASFREVRAKRYLADDVTMEKLTSLLYENEGKFGIFWGEGQIFSVFAGQYSKNEIFDIILKSYSGEDVRVDRQGRPSEYVKDPALTMLLAIQPSVLEEIVANKNFQGRGLIGRIFFSLPPSFVGYRKFDTSPIPDRIRNKYRELIRTLLSYEVKKAIPLELSTGARTELEFFFNETEGRLLGDMHELHAFGGKLPGLVSRIAGNLHVAIYPEFPEKHLIDANTVRAAIEIGRYALSHTFEAMEGARDSITEACQYIVARITHNEKMESLTKRDILRFCRRFKTVNELTPYIQRLIDHGYLEPQEEEHDGPGRPSVQYRINPHIYNET